MKQTTNKRFTLIELLVVVAIIGILASMLLPALSAARDKAKASTCLSRNKQFSMWNSFYKDENDSYFIPNRTWFSSGAGALLYTNLIDDYMEAEMSNTSWKNSSSKNYFLCPSDYYAPPPTQSATQIRYFAYISDGWRVVNYMPNSFFGYGTYESQARIWRPKKGLDGRSADMLVEMTEIKSSSGNVGYYKKTSNMIYPHSNKTAASFIDGHAGFISNPATAQHGTQFIFY